MLSLQTIETAYAGKDHHLYTKGNPLMKILNTNKMCFSHNIITQNLDTINFLQTYFAPLRNSASQLKNELNISQSVPPIFMYIRLYVSQVVYVIQTLHFLLTRCGFGIDRKPCSTREGGLIRSTIERKMFNRNHLTVVLASPILLFTSTE